MSTEGDPGGRTDPKGPPLWIEAAYPASVSAPFPHWSDRLTYADKVTTIAK